MDNFSRMGLSAHTTIVKAQQAELRRQAAEARLLRTTTVDDAPEGRPVVGRSLGRRLVAFFERRAAHAPVVHRVGH
jgi:hypothetical protein